MGCDHRAAEVDDGGSKRDRTHVPRDGGPQRHDSQGLPDMPHFNDGPGPVPDARRDLHVPHVLDGLPPHPDARRDLPSGVHDLSGKPDMPKAKLDGGSDT